MIPKVLVYLVIVIVSMALFSMIVGKLLGLQNDIPIDVVECQQSAHLSLQVGSTLPKLKSFFDLRKLPFVCPVDELNISKKDISYRLSSAERSEFYRLKYASEEKYTLDSIMWKEMQQCYQKMFYGESPLFSRNLFEIQDPSKASFCVVCSIVDFDDEVKTEFGGQQNFLSMMREKHIPGKEISLLEKSQDHKDIVEGTLMPYYRTDSTQAVVYFRTNVPTFGNELLGAINLGAEFVDLYGEAYGPIFGFDYESIADDEPYELKNQEWIAFVDYDDQDVLKSQCDTVAAQVERAQS